MKKVHILLVEDNEGDIFLTREAFEECKIKVDLSVVKNGSDALDFVFNKNEYQENSKPDIILLDINIPMINGLEVLKEIKNNPFTKKIPVIILTTSNNPIDIEKAYSYYTNSYITKPINMEQFLNVVLKIEQFWLELCSLPN